MRRSEIDDAGGIIKFTLYAVNRIRISHLNASRLGIVRVEKSEVVNRLRDIRPTRREWKVDSAMLR